MLEEEQDNGTFEGGNFSASVSIVDTPEEIDDEHEILQALAAAVHFGAVTHVAVRGGIFLPRQPKKGK